MKNTIINKLKPQTDQDISSKKHDVGFIPLFRHKPTDIASDSLIIDTLMNNSQNTIYFKDVNSKFILFDDALAKAFGVKDHAQLISKSDADVFPEVLAKQKRQDEIVITKTGIPIIDKMEQTRYQRSRGNFDPFDFKISALRL